MSELLVSCMGVFDHIHCAYHWEEEPKGLLDFRDYMVTQLKILQKVEGNEDVVFALAATVDDVVLNKKIKHRDVWVKNTLQGEFFSTQNGGEMFYEKLKLLLAEKNKIKLEIFLFCLYFGFYGKYRIENKKIRQGYISQICQILNEERQIVSDHKKTYSRKIPYLAISFVLLQSFFLLIFFLRNTWAVHQTIKTLRSLI